MSKTPPNRRGITFEVGAQLEARDSLKNWYAANIEKIDYDDEKVLVHYRQWSHRYDEWFDWTSPYLRPVERIQLRRQGLQEDAPVPEFTAAGETRPPHTIMGFHVNDKVLASWSDCRFYPAKVLTVNKDASYTVKFYDGVVQTVKGIHVKPFVKERGGVGGPKTRSSDRNSIRKVQNGRNRRPQENGGPKNKRARRSTSDQEEDSNSEDEEDEEWEEGPVDDDKSKKKDTEGEVAKDAAPAIVREEGGVVKDAVPAIAQEEGGVVKDVVPAIAREEGGVVKDVVPAITREEGGVVKDAVPAITREEGGVVKDAVPAITREEGGVVKDAAPAIKREEGEVKDAVPAIKREEGEVKDAAPAIKREEGEEAWQPTGQNKLRDGDKETGLSNGVKEEEEEEKVQKEESSCHLNGTIKKEEVEMELNETKPYTESPSQTSAQTSQVSVTMTTTTTTTTTTANGKVEVKPASQSDSSQAAVVAPPAQPVKPVRKQGFHNPNRFSREPLYRVIKNQPPPVLSINLDHNPFKCSAPGCTKSFRKAKLLHYHMKYYHGEDQAQEADLSPTRSIQTRASEKQAAAALESPKRRRTISATMHPGGAPPSSRGEVKTAGRRTSAPPAVNVQGQQQRALLREKSKENQLDRNGCQPQEKDGEKSGFDIALVKEKDRLRDKPKQKDFLRIKLKKKKKKKAKSEYTGSEENIDISILGLQSKLNLPPKFPLSHKNKPEAYPSRPGYKHSEQIHVDDEDSMSDWSTDSCGWSDDDFGVDLDVTTSTLSVDSVALDTSDQEIVRCICEVEEENDFMIQCEECLCWQHGTCMGLLEENVPDRYACYICRDPPGQRQSLRYWYDREWLSNGHMYGLSFLEENYSHQNSKKIAATHQLLGDIHHVVEVLSGLQLKMSVLQSKTHPDLRLWCQPWKLAERPWKTYDSCPGTDAAPSPATPDEDMSRGEILMSNALEKLSRAATSSTTTSSSSSCSSSSSPYLSFQESYISSEHCYQKPRAYYPAVEQRLVVETRQGSELEDSMRSTEDLLEREQRYGALLDTDRPKALSANTKASTAGWWSQAEGKEEGTICGGGAAEDSRQQQWQINLLDHIDAVQDEVSHRMDFIERELDVLESWLDYSGELEPPEPLARLPQLKHRMKQLLTELNKVQQISLCCST